MRETKKVYVLGAAVLVAMFLGYWAGRASFPLRKVHAAPPASPEMDRVAKMYLGTWEYTETYPKSPMIPAGGVNTGVYKSELGPGGNSLVNRFHSQGPVGDFEGLLIYTWDPKEKTYKYYAFGNDFPGAVICAGNFEGDALVFHGEFDAGDAKMAFRNVARLDEKGTMTVQEFMTMPGQPEALVVTVAAKRKP
jgi:Protein of unknown function (DUF1579)